MLNTSKTLKYPLSVTRAAINKYDMIKKDDKIAVAVSGGKDSLLLLVLLSQLRHFLDIPFSIAAITIDPCFYGKETDFSKVTALCENMGINHIIKRTELWKIVFEDKKESNPCSLCARMRRGTLHKICNDHGFNKLALGHNKNDVAETFMMNLLNGGRIDCFSPISYLSRRDIYMIRPMIYLEENKIKSAAEKLNLPIVPSNCPVDGKTNREVTKNLISYLGTKNDNVDDKIINALKKGNIHGW